MTRAQRIGWLAALLTVQALILFWRLRSSYLFLDDFLNFMLYDDVGLNWSYLYRDVFGQVAPGYRLLQAAYLEVFGVHYFGCILICGALSLLSTLFLVLIGERAKVPRWGIASAAIVHAFLMQPTHAEQWWSAAAHPIPSVAATLGALWFLVGPVGAGPTVRGRVGAAFCFALALSFTAKALFGPIVMIAVLLHLRRGQGVAWRAALRMVISDLRYFIPVVIAYGTMVALHSRSIPVEPSAWTFILFVWNALADGTIAATLGLGSHGVPIPNVLSIAVALLVAGGIVVVTVRARRANAILWIGLVAYVIVAMSVVASQRAGQFGADAGASLRYGVEGGTFFVLVFMLSLSALKPSATAQRIAVALSVLVAINLQLQSARITHGWDLAAVRSYLYNLRSSLRELQGRTGVVILDSTLPAVILIDWMAPYNRTSKFLPLFTKSYPIAGPDRATYEIGDDGRVKRR